MHTPLWLTMWLRRVHCSRGWKDRRCWSATPNGGFVISEAATDAPGVVGLVYISAFILDEGETLLSSGARFPQLEVFQHLLVTGQGFAWIDPDVFPQNFANDLDPVEARALAVAQVPP